MKSLQSQIWGDGWRGATPGSRGGSESSGRECGLAGAFKAQPVVPEADAWSHMLPLSKLLSASESLLMLNQNIKMSLQLWLYKRAHWDGCACNHPEVWMGLFTVCHEPPVSFRRLIMCKYRHWPGWCTLLKSRNAVPREIC